MPRDTQRSKLYRAEGALDPFSQPLPTVDDVERFALKVWRSERVRKAFRTVSLSSPPRVKDGRGTSWARGGYSTINIPLWARNTRIVLHELAHTIHIREGGARGAAHGWQYAAVFLKLVLYMAGREAHDALKASFKEHRVKFRPPRQKRELTTEQRAALATRLAAARTRKNGGEVWFPPDRA